MLYGIMRETEFIHKNKDEWESFEEELKKKRKDPEKLSDLYTRITDDLSYARTYYNNRTVRYYLNALSQSLYLSVNKFRLPSRNNIRSFWRYELPAVLYWSRRDILLSLIVFTAAAAAGAFSTMQDPDFPRAILGDQYVNQTIANIEKGDPMAVYKEQNAFDMFMYITLNNIYVSCLVFVLGILAGIGSVGMLISNGVMLGSFQYFFFYHNVGPESAVTIWQHGTIEISSIVIAGAAGLRLGKGFIFPGSYTRSQALKSNAVQAFKIMLGLVPMFVIAAIIESFVTRQTELDISVRLFVIVSSAVLILGYYVVLPARLPREIKEKYRFKALRKTEEKTEIKFDEVKSQSKIYKETFISSRIVAAKLFVPLFITAAAVTVVLTLLHASGSFSHNALLLSAQGFGRYFSFMRNPAHIPLFAGSVTLIAYSFLRVFKALFAADLNVKPVFLFKAGVITMVFSTVFLTAGFLKIALVILLIPAFVNALTAIAAEDQNALTAAVRSLAGYAKIPRFIAAYAFTLFTCFGLLFLLNQPLTGTYLQYILDVLPAAPENAEQTGMFLLFLIQQFSILLIFIILFAFGILSYYRNREIDTAESLIGRIRRFKTKFDHEN